MHEFTKESSRWPKKCDIVLRHLLTSKRQITFKLKAKGLQIARRRLAKRMRNGPLCCRGRGEAL